MRDADTDLCVDHNQKHDAALREAAGKIQRILIDLADKTLRDVDYVDVDCRNWANCKTEIGLR